MARQKITDDMSVLLGIMPAGIADAVEKVNNNDNLIEIILDLGRLPTARYTDGEIVLREENVTREEIDFVVTGIGDIDEDNRAGIERTLHRIAAIRNRRGTIVGLTCRVGRSVYGTLDIIEDLITSGKSLLLLGRPGVGKTTILREAARVLSETYRVVIVDTSNEIGGDGDVPHPAVGRARRMQVATPSLQHEVMIEAVENHNPEVIVIDEIGRELEAVAARTIAERGVQLIGTAHGHTLDNLLLNPTLSDLVGGIESVTLSDDEARRRGTQKTVLERRSPPTFDVLIEIQTRDRLSVYKDIASAIDALLRGNASAPEIRTRGTEGKIEITKAPTPAPGIGRDPQGFMRSGQQTKFTTRETANTTNGSRTERKAQAPSTPLTMASRSVQAAETLAPMRVYPYGVARNRLMQAAKRLKVPAIIVQDVGEADVMVTLRSYYRNRQRTIIDAENRGMPMYVLRANTVTQMERFLGELFNLTNNNDQGTPETENLESARLAINAVLNGERWVELPPASSYVRRLQHQLARESNLVSHSIGKDPHRRVRIFREQSQM